MYKSILVLLFTALIPITHPTPLPKTEHHTPQSNIQAPNLRMAWWTNARFGMFIHWGIYAVPAHAEWYMNNGHVPLKQYEKYASQFDPVKFNANRWVSIAKQAGMKYIVITSKHHDGFVMFHTKTTHYNVVDDTPWHKDPLKALSKACREQGIHFCVYYSIMDWHSPFQAPHDNSNPQHPTYNPTKMRPGKKGDYVKYMKTQLKELITQYSPDVLWFDGEWPDWWTYEDGKDLYQYVRSLKPSIIVNNRVGKRKGGMGNVSMNDAVGDFGTPEQHIPPNGLPGVKWESCMTINNNWGYDKNDHNFKSDTTLIHNLIDIASKGGNYLLNVGPTAEGVIPKPEVDRLHAMGEWLKTHGEAIYGTAASPFSSQFSWGRVTSKPGKLYLEVFHWMADGSIRIPNLKQSIQSARLLDDPSRKISINMEADSTVVHLPGKSPNPYAAVIELDLK